MNILILLMNYFGQNHSGHGFAIVAGEIMMSIGHLTGMRIMVPSVNTESAWKKS
jgi:hypothetical protein